MNRYEHTDWLLGNSEVGLNESTKQYTAERRLDFVLEHLNAIIEETPLEESNTIGFMDKLFEVESIINIINGGVDEESLEEDVSVIGPIATVLGGILGTFGARSVISHWAEHGKIIPTKLSNLFFDIKQFISGDKEKEEQMVKELMLKMNVSEKRARELVKKALAAAPEKKAKYKPTFDEWDRLNKKYQIRKDFL